jgi:hypothetical protein
MGLRSGTFSCAAVPEKITGKTNRNRHSRSGCGIAFFDDRRTQLIVSGRFYDAAWEIPSPWHIVCVLA